MTSAINEWWIVGVFAAVTLVVVVANLLLPKDDDALDGAIRRLRFTGPTCWLYERRVPYPVARLIGTFIGWALNAWDDVRR